MSHWYMYFVVECSEAPIVMSPRLGTSLPSMMLHFKVAAYLRRSFKANSKNAGFSSDRKSEPSILIILSVSL